MPRHKASVQEIRLGAIYRTGSRLALPRDSMIDLMTGRAGMKPADAEQLIAHWLTSEPLRCNCPTPSLIRADRDATDTREK